MGNEADSTAIDSSIEDERLDEYAQSIFPVMGYPGKLPDSMIRIYREFKRRKDSFQPGRLTPEGFATVIMLSDLTDGRFSPDKDPVTEEPEHEPSDAAQE